MGIRPKFALVIGLFAATTFVSSCVTPRVACSMAPDAGTFVGRVVEVHGSAVIFRVETVQPNRSDFAADVPQPVEGHLVVVHYQYHDEQFLHVGQRYLVKVWPIFHFSSSVHTANHPCSGGTQHADGSQIDTSLLHQPHTLRVFLNFVTALAVAGVFVTALAMRKRRRQRKNVEELLGSGA